MDHTTISYRLPGPTVRDQDQDPQLLVSRPVLTSRPAVLQCGSKDKGIWQKKTCYDTTMLLNTGVDPNVKFTINGFLEKRFFRDNSLTMSNSLTFPDIPGFLEKWSPYVVCVVSNVLQVQFKKSCPSLTMSPESVS